MTPTTWRTLVSLVVLAGIGGFLLADQAYGSLVTLPAYAPVTALVIALFELGLAKTIHDQLRGRSRGKAMHPLQLARAVALAKASSAAGALLLGLYAGYFTWTFPRRNTLAVASHDALVSGLSAAAALLLLVAALVLERVCRARGPRPDAEEQPD